MQAKPESGRAGEADSQETWDGAEVGRRGAGGDAGESLESGAGDGDAGLTGDQVRLALVLR